MTLLEFMLESMLKIIFKHALKSKLYLKALKAAFDELKALNCQSLDAVKLTTA